MRPLLATLRDAARFALSQFATQLTDRKWIAVYLKAIQGESVALEVYMLTPFFARWIETRDDLGRTVMPTTWPQISSIFKLLDGCMLDDEVIFKLLSDEAAKGEKWYVLNPLSSAMLIRDGEAGEAGIEAVQHSINKGLRTNGGTRSGVIMPLHNKKRNH